MDTTGTPTTYTKPGPNRHERRRLRSRYRRVCKALAKWTLGNRLTPRQHRLLDSFYGEMGEVAPHKDVDSMLGTSEATK